MPRKKEILPPVSSQEMEEKKTRKKSSTKESPHQTSEPGMDKVDLKDLDATAKSAQKKSIVSRKKKQVKDSDSSLECPKDTEAVPPETTKPKRKRRTKAEMEAARKELEKEIGEKTLEKETEEQEKKKMGRKKEVVTEDVKKEAESEETKKKATSKKVEDKVVPTEAQTQEMQTKEAQAASKPAKKTKKSRKKELIYAVCLKNGGEMVVEEAGEKTRKKYEGAMYELMISDTLAVLKKSDVPSARIKPLEEDMYYEINDELYHVEFYRNGRRIG